MIGLKNPFMPEDPMESLQKGNFNKMPILIGHVTEEGCQPFTNDPSLLEYLDRHFDALANILIFNRLPGICSTKNCPFNRYISRGLKVWGSKGSNMGLKRWSRGTDRGDDVQNECLMTF